MDQLTKEQKIDPEELPEIITQLNRGQSAVVTNTEGTPLRLWVNPKERSRGFESLVTQPDSPGSKRNYRKIAANELRQHLGSAVETCQMEEFACSVAEQWQKYEGHACLFIDKHHELVITLTENGDGSCKVVTVRQNINLEPVLTSLGFLPEVIHEVMSRINLGQEVEFRDSKGVPSVLWHDPKARRVRVRPRGDSIRKPKFNLGEVEVQKEAAVALAQAGQEASYFLQRHASGDWGDISDKAMAENDHRLKAKQDVVSAYHTNLGEKFLVCTTSDRKRTVVFIPGKSPFDDFLKGHW